MGPLGRVSLAPPYIVILQGCLCLRRRYIAEVI